MVSEIEVAVRLLQEVQKVAKKLHLVASVMLSHTSYIICLLRYNMHDDRKRICGSAITIGGAVACVLQFQVRLS